MSNLSMSYYEALSTEIVESISACLDAHGLDRTLKDYEGMEHLQSGRPYWPEIKAGAERMFAKERKRLEQLELARAKASAPNYYQMFPTAEAAIKMDNTHFEGSMYDMKGSDNVTFGSNHGEEKH